MSHDPSSDCSLVSSRWQRDHKYSRETEGARLTTKTTEILISSLPPDTSSLTTLFSVSLRNFSQSHLPPLLFSRSSLSTPGLTRPGNVPAARCLTWTDRTASVVFWTLRRMRAAASSCADTSYWTHSREAWCGSWTTHR